MTETIAEVEDRIVNLKNGLKNARNKLVQLRIPKPEVKSIVVFTDVMDKAIAYRDWVDSGKGFNNNLYEEQIVDEVLKAVFDQDFYEWMNARV